MLGVLQFSQKGNFFTGTKIGKKKKKKTDLHDLQSGKICADVRIRVAPTLKISDEHKLLLPHRHSGSNEVKPSDHMLYILCSFLLPISKKSKNTGQTLQTCDPSNPGKKISDRRISEILVHGKKRISHSPRDQLVEPVDNHACDEQRGHEQIRSVHLCLKWEKKKI